MSAPSISADALGLVVEANNDWGHAAYEGTRAQLEEEGVIPSSIEWPTSERSVSWERAGLRFFLRRTRPANMKGPKKLWVQGDYWHLDINVAGRDRGCWNEQHRVDLKRRELAREIYRQSPAGQRDSRRYWAAHDDKAFQTFKAQIPGLIPPKRGGRKPRSGVSSATT